VLGVLAVAALVSVTVLVALVLPSDEGDSADPVERADVDLVSFRDPQGAYEVSVPEGWVSASLEGDISDLGRELFPDDPGRAAVVQQRLSSIPRAVIFMSLDSDQIGAGFTRNFTVVRIPGAGGGGRDNLVAQARQAVAGTDVTDEGSFLAAGREGVRVEYDVSGAISGVAYVLDVGGDVWALVYTSLDLPEEEPLADEVAATFAPGVGG
jgi:hypothetical protein